MIELLVLSLNVALCPPHITRHDTRQLLTGKSCNVRGCMTPCDTTRQKLGLVVSDLTMLDICNKARFLSCRRPPHITRFSCRRLSCCVALAMYGGHLTSEVKSKKMQNLRVGSHQRSWYGLMQRTWRLAITSI